MAKWGEEDHRSNSADYGRITRVNWKTPESLEDDFIIMLEASHSSKVRNPYFPIWLEVVGGWMVIKLRATNFVLASPSVDRRQDGVSPSPRSAPTTATAAVYISWSSRGCVGLGGEGERRLISVATK